MKSAAVVLRDPSRAISSRIPALISLGIAVTGAVLLQRGWRRRGFSVPGIFRRRSARGQGVANQLMQQVGLPLLAVAAHRVGQGVLNRVLAKLGPLDLGAPPNERTFLEKQHAPAAE